ncbi:MAG: translation elongation factor Ts [Eubacteriales bacterium]|jgi:elongation factor Ts|nr:translation elongation factor Ts [Eubacteriales bacterium]
MDITMEMIKDLREKTGAGMMDCKKALMENSGDIDKSIAWLRTKGIASAAKKSSRIAAEGIVDSYIHANGRIGVLIEVNIETDFAAKNDMFKDFVKDCAMQIAAMNPKWISQSDVPAAEIDAEKDVLRTKALNDGKPEKIVEKIVEGGLKKFYDENCLLNQAFVKDESKTIDSLLKETIAKIGENISVRRFVRYEMGEGLQKKEDDFAQEVMSQIK